MTFPAFAAVYNKKITFSSTRKREIFFFLNSFPALIGWLTNHLCRSVLFNRTTRLISLSGSSHADSGEGGSPCWEPAGGLWECLVCSQPNMLGTCVRKCPKSMLQPEVSLQDVERYRADPAVLFTCRRWRMTGTVCSSLPKTEAAKVRKEAERKDVRMDTTSSDLWPQPLHDENIFFCSVSIRERVPCKDLQPSGSRSAWSREL